MTEQLTTEDYKNLDNETQAKKDETRKYNTELVKAFCIKYHISIKTNTEYHFTLYKTGFKRLDVYPTTGKVKTFSGKSKTKIVSLKQYLPSYYNVSRPAKPLTEPVVTEQTINGVQACIDHIEHKLSKIDDNKVHTVLTAIIQELQQYL